MPENKLYELTKQQEQEKRPKMTPEERKAFRAKVVSPMLQKDIAEFYERYPNPMLRDEDW